MKRLFSVTVKELDMKWIDCPNKDQAKPSEEECKIGWAYEREGETTKRGMALDVPVSTHAHYALSLFLAFAVSALAFEVEYERCVRYLSFDLQTKPNWKPLHSIQLRKGSNFLTIQGKEVRSQAFSLIYPFKKKEELNQQSKLHNTWTSWVAPKSSSFS